MLLGGATSTSLPYLAGLPLSMGFQKGAGLVSVRGVASAI